MARLKLITLLTDFGVRDPYVAEMKGVILGLCPEAQIVDLCHEIEPYDIRGAAFILSRATRRFPPGTVHVVVVDPGVGTERAILAGQFAGQIYLFPDNGVISFVARELPMEAVAVVRDLGGVLPADVSRTFHGRDIFAPVAAHLVENLDVIELGPTPQSYELLEIPEPQWQEDTLTGQIVYVDRFGNLISNISRELLARRWEDEEEIFVHCAGRDVGALRAMYGAAEESQPIALLNSMELLEIAINRGRACDVLGVGIGAPVRAAKVRQSE